MPLFEFDPVGNLTSNRIPGELHTVTGYNGSDHNYMVPRNAPFYDTSMVVIDTATGDPLVPEQDYIFGYPFEEATDKVGRPISGAVVLTDPNRNGAFKLVYQTLGGEYVNEDTQTIEDGLDALINLINRDWNTLTNVPLNFPPTPHTERLDTFNGVPEILAKFTSLEAAIRAINYQVGVDDIIDFDTALLQPLQTGLSAVAAAITALAGGQNFYHVSVNLGTTPIPLGPIGQNQWVDTGLTAAPAFRGTYQITFGGNPKVLINAGAPQVEFRFVVQGQPISQSTLQGTTVGLTEGQEVGLQLRLSGGSATEVIVAGNGVSCGLTLLRVGD